MRSLQSLFPPTLEYLSIADKAQRLAREWERLKLDWMAAQLASMPAGTKAWEVVYLMEGEVTRDLHLMPPDGPMQVIRMPTLRLDPITSTQSGALRQSDSTSAAMGSNTTTST